MFHALSIKAHLADSEGLKFLCMSVAQSGAFELLLSLTTGKVSPPAIATILRWLSFTLVYVESDLGSYGRMCATGLRQPMVVYPQS